MNDKEVGIYIHIPFCKRECFYCHFVKYPFQKTDVDKYAIAVVKEIHLKSQQNVKINSIYYGGGTPSSLNESQISSIMNGLHNNFSINPDSEITIECNPEDLTREKSKSLKSIGFNRLSIGVQSFDQEDLKYLNRNHTELQSEKAIANAMESGFINLNIDFIIGLPHQNPVSLKKNFSYISRFNIPHISCYLLEMGKCYTTTNKNEQSLYYYTKDYLQSAGYNHYEISNYCLKGFESVHNLKYWNNNDYIGIGLSASGYENRMDYRNTEIVEEYFEKISTDSFPIKETHRFDPELRRIVVGLRLLNGIPVSHFQNYKKKMELLISDGVLKKKKHLVYVNPEKILLLNEILLNLL